MHNARYAPRGSVRQLLLKLELGGHNIGSEGNTNIIEKDATLVFLAVEKIRQS